MLLRPPGGVTETFGYDVQSRLQTWTTSSPLSTRTFAYDGSGRLRRVTRTGSGAATETYYYDVDDGMPYEIRTAGGVTTHVFRHEGWDLRATTPTTYTVTEQVLPMLAYRGTEEIVRLTEPDGHALYARGSATQTEEGLGAFGLRLSKYVTNADGWVEDGLHGEEVHRAAEVVHYGARHLGLRDGMWLQPEPLLYLGLTNGNLAAPLGYSGVYAAGDTNSLADRSGYAPITEEGLQADPAPATLEPTPELIAAAIQANRDSIALQAPGFKTGAMPEKAYGIDWSSSGEAVPNGEVAETVSGGPGVWGTAGGGHGHGSGHNGSSGISGADEGVTAARANEPNEVSINVVSYEKPGGGTGIDIAVSVNSPKGKVLSVYSGGADQASFALKRTSIAPDAAKKPVIAPPSLPAPSPPR